MQLMVKELINGLIEGNILVIGKITKCMVKDFSNGQTVEYTMVNIKMT